VYNLKFQSSRRLRTAADFKQIYRKCRKISYDAFLLRYKFVAAENPSRFGIVVSKKTAARAVDRNRIRRIAKECFRHKMNNSTGLDIILTANSVAKNISSSELAACVYQILDQFVKPASV
jgi:ribonuclease P protein component